MMRATPDPQPSYTMIAAAARIAQRLGLHASLDHDSLATDELVQRKNVFWIAYILDKGACLRSGCPPTLHDEDVGVRLPDSEWSSIQFHPEEPRFSVFRSITELASLEGKVYSQLYSVRSRLHSGLQRLRSVAQLDNELEAWKGRLPVSIRPGHGIRCDQRCFMAILMLHFSYYDCLETVHRASPHHRSWFTELDQACAVQDDGANSFSHRVYSSTAISMDAARSTVDLMRYFTHDDARPRESLNWMAVYYPLSATLTLFANIIQNPEGSTAKSDLGHMRLVADFLSTYMAADHSKSIAANRTILIFQELYRTAIRHVDKVRAKALHKEKRQRETSPTSNEVADITYPIKSPQHFEGSTLVHPPTYKDPLMFQPTTENNVPLAPCFLSPTINATRMDRSPLMPGEVPNFEWDVADLWGPHSDSGAP